MRSSLLGIANLAAVLRTPGGEVVQAAGLRSRVFDRFTRVDHPMLVAAVGAAFAISFDTISQAVLFSITGSNLAGWTFATILGLVFTAGMMATDALNGLWVSQLVRSADRRAAAASRTERHRLPRSRSPRAGARHVLPALDERVAS
jgi:high-affinity nickel-transport protein